MKNEDVEELIKKIRELALTKKLNFLLGSGTSSPAIPLMNKVNGKDNKERNINLTDVIKKESKKLLNGKFNDDSKDDDSKNIKNSKTILRTYENFILAISNILDQSNSRQVPKEVNIFTTNYDLFIEKAIDNVISNTNLYFNDGARGYFNRYLDSANFNKTVSYRGLNDNYIDELPSLTLIKPHGSINWENINDKRVLIKNEIAKEPLIVPPNHMEGEATFLNNHFHDMLRVFQLELDKPESVLFVLGFSFQDDHIARMIRRALQNKELIIICFGYSNNDKDIYLKNLEYKDNEKNQAPNNLKIYTPSDFWGDDLKKSEFTLSNLVKVLNDGKL
ncbi:MAG: SIR2 family protein [Lactobacillus sp.]|uniref:SIR2 family protein n=1 Tax=Bombilactobacillus bombi TaxID=1303590 RepID=UPI0035E6FB12|nr:SIR2 family protein [Lactobacillus sp.]